MRHPPDSIQISCKFVVITKFLKEGFCIVKEQNMRVPEDCSTQALKSLKVAIEIHEDTSYVETL